MCSIPAYLSEFPDTSRAYGPGLLLCRVLPGQSFDMTAIKMGCDLQPGYDSHRAGKDGVGRGQELVIFNPAQILPCYIVHLDLMNDWGEGGLCF